MGIEREFRSKAAGLRTMIVICLGSTIFTEISLSIGGNRLYSLSNEEGTPVHFVTEQQLDKRSLIDMCIETYLRFSERA
jgi:uncharacterized membrane protein YhiD involved in acid resistance